MLRVSLLQPPLMMCGHSAVALDWITCLAAKCALEIVYLTPLASEQHDFRRPLPTPMRTAQPTAVTVTARTRPIDSTYLVYT